MDVNLFQRISGGWEYRYTRDGVTYSGFDHDPVLARAQLFRRLGQDLLGQLVCFEQLAESQDGDPSGQPFVMREAGEVAVQRDVEQGLFHRQVDQAEPLLHEVQARHGLKRERRAACLLRRCCRRHQRDQFTPRHDQFHLVEEFRLAGAQGAQVQADVLLFHEGVVPGVEASGYRGLAGVLNTFLTGR